MSASCSCWAALPGLLVVAGGVSGQFEHLGGQVLHDSGQVDGRAGSRAFGIVALAQQPVDAAHRELKTAPGTSETSASPSTCLWR